MSPRPLARPTAAFAAALALAGAAAPAAADALGAYYERAVMSAANQRCGLFTPELASALASAEAQARGAALRSGASAAALGQVEQRAQSKAGAVLLKLVNRRAGTTRLLSEATRGDGERVWMRPVRAPDEQDLDAYVERTVKIDPDVWVVEIEDNQGRHFLVEPVEDDPQGG